MNKNHCLYRQHTDLAAYHGARRHCMAAEARDLRARRASPPSLPFLTLLSGVETAPDVMSPEEH